MRPELSTSPTLLRSLFGPGADAAWPTFVERYAPLVADRCRRAGLQPADADDVRQQVFAHLSRALAGFRYDPGRRFRGYLTRAVDNAIRSRWRALARKPGLVGRGGRDLPEPLAALPADLDDVLSEELASVSRVVEAVRFEVGADAWAAFWLTTMDGLSGAEAAARLGKTPSAVYVAKSRVLARLRAALGSSGSDG
jgi:RNA polymerase sigma-70 factor (ECF subfamily)